MEREEVVDIFLKCRHFDEVHLFTEMVAEAIGLDPIGDRAHPLIVERGEHPLDRFLGRKARALEMWRDHPRKLIRLGFGLGKELVDLVHNHSIAAHPGFFQAITEEDRLTDGEGVRARHHDKGDVVASERFGDLGGMCAKSAEEIVQAGDEFGDLF